MEIKQKQMIEELMKIAKQKFNQCANLEEKKSLVNEYYNKIINKKDEYLCFEFAKEYSRFLTKEKVNKIGNIILEKKNSYLSILFPKYFKTENLEHFASVVKEGPVFYVIPFLYAFPNFDANYFAQKMAKEGSAEQNLKYVLENDISFMLPHSIKIAKDGDAQQNFDFILGVDCFVENYSYNDIKANVNSLIMSGDPGLNLEYVLVFKPKRNLEKHAKVIADSDDLLLNFLACENWPNRDPLELSIFTKVIHSHSIQELENRLIFNLRILDKNFRKSIISKYFDIGDKKIIQNFNKDTEQDIEKE